MCLIHIVAGNAMEGGQRYALDICRHYAAPGGDVIAMTRDAKAIDSEFAAAGVPLVHAPLRDYPDVFSSIILKNILKSRRGVPVVVHTHRYRDALTAIIARKLAARPDVKIVISRHISSPAKKNSLRRFIYRQVDAHIFSSGFSRKEFLSAWPQKRFPFDPSRLHVVFDSRLLSDNHPAPEPQKGAVTAMYHGTLRPGKGLKTLLRAFSKLKDTRLRLRIVGRGDSDYVDMLRRLAVTLGIMESIDWRLDSSDPAALIANCHFGVLPGETPDSGGMANIEYMAMGRPQICTFNGAQREYLTSGREALRVEPADVEGLAEQMRRLYSDKELRLRIGTAARKRYEESLSWPRFITKIHNIYTSNSCSICQS